MDSYGIIYLAVNSVNGKKYVGQTTESLRIRRNRHVYKANSGATQILYNAIRKYGKDAFEWSIIDEAFSPVELDEKEIYWVDYYRTFIDWEDCHGYNMTIGGDSTILSQESREKIRQSRLGKTYKMSDRHKRNLVMSRKGYRHSLETKEKLSISARNRDNSSRLKPIVQLTFDGCFVAEYKSTVDLIDSFREWKKSTINSCLKGRLKSAYGYKWFYKSDYDNYLNNKCDLDIAYQGSYHGSRRPKPVVQLNLDGSLIKEFSNAKEAGIAIGNKNGSAVTSCCKGRHETHLGYKWMYADEYYEKMKQEEVITSET